jgi:hypothetical protein
MTDTIETRDLKKSPFYKVFRKYPWLPFVIMFSRRLSGAYHEFVGVYVKPFTTKKDWWDD